MKMPGAIAFIAAALFLILQPVQAQGVLTIATDEAQYDYGEPIEISVTVENPTDETFELSGSSSCQAQFHFDDFSSSEHTICTADLIEIVFPPGSQRTWTWLIVPEEIGLPTSSGEHTVIGYYDEMADTITVEAPAYLGGQLSVGIEPTATEEDIKPVKDSLNAQVIDSWESTNGAVEQWIISGVSVDSAAARYDGDPRFRYVEAFRMIEYYEVVSAEDRPDVAGSAKVSAAYPNPFTDAFTLELEIRRSEYVRIAVFDILGREVEVLHDGMISGPGRREIRFEAGSLANGLYVIRAEGMTFSVARAALLTR